MYGAPLGLRPLRAVLRPVVVREVVVRVVEPARQRRVAGLGRGRGGRRQPDQQGRADASSDGTCRILRDRSRPRRPGDVLPSCIGPAGRRGSGAAGPGRAGKRKTDCRLVPARTVGPPVRPMPDGGARPGRGFPKSLQVRGPRPHADPHQLYDNPLIGRYASKAMAERWGPRRKFGTWRRLWLCARRGRGRTGLARRRRQVAAHPPGAARRSCGPTSTTSTSTRPPSYEQRLRHDVMAHIHTLGDAAPAARDIIHLGATSCYVTDNTDLILMREALDDVCGKLAAVIDALGTFADHWRAEPTLGLHPLPAGPADDRRQAGDALVLRPRPRPARARSAGATSLKFRGAKGTTGTQASFLALFRGDHEKVAAARRLVATKIGLRRRLPGHRADLLAEGRHAGPRRPGRARAEPAQVGHRPAAAGPPAGDRRAVRGRAGRLVGDGLQAEPDAGRADVRRWPGS